MYDINKRIKILNATVGDVIDELSKLPRNAHFCCCGEDRMYIHVETDNSVVSIDTEDLDEDYVDDPETNPDDYWNSINKNSTDQIPSLSGTISSGPVNIELNLKINDEPICVHPEGDVICE